MVKGTLYGEDRDLKGYSDAERLQRSTHMSAVNYRAERDAAVSALAAEREGHGVTRADRDNTAAWLAAELAKGARLESELAESKAEDNQRGFLRDEPESPTTIALKAKIASLPSDKVTALWDKLQKLANEPPPDESLIAYVRHEDGTKTPITPKQWAQAVLAHPKATDEPAPGSGEPELCPHGFLELTACQECGT